MSLLREYNPKKVIVTWLGINIEGFADGTLIELSRNEDNMTVTVEDDSTNTAVITAP